MRSLTLCILFLLTVTLARAQDATPDATDGWTIEQRCVGEPVDQLTVQEGERPADTPKRKVRRNTK